jgi:hypothetical protein
VEFKARVEQAEFEYLEQLRADRCQARSKALTQVLRLYASGRTGAHCDTLLGYPMQWQIMGAGTTMNLSNGLPYYHGVVMFPSPILARSH